jgi:hypothetical protein
LAIVFDAYWDIESAVKLRSGREDVLANVVSPRLRLEGDAVIEGPASRPWRRYPVASLYVFNLDDKTLVRFENFTSDR